MDIVVVEQDIERAALGQMAEQGFGDLVKAVVDVGRRIMAVGGELHSDEEATLLKSGSQQSDLWVSTCIPPLKGMTGLSLIQ